MKVSYDSSEPIPLNQIGTGVPLYNTEVILQSYSSYSPENLDSRLRHFHIYKYPSWKDSIYEILKVPNKLIDFEKNLPPLKGVTKETDYNNFDVFLSGLYTTSTPYIDIMRGKCIINNVQIEIDEPVTLNPLDILFNNPSTNYIDSSAYIGLFVYYNYDNSGNEFSSNSPIKASYKTLYFPMQMQHYLNNYNKLCLIKILHGNLNKGNQIFDITSQGSILNRADNVTINGDCSWMGTIYHSGFTVNLRREEIFEKFVTNFTDLSSIDTTAHVGIMLTSIDGSVVDNDYSGYYIVNEYIQPYSYIEEVTDSYINDGYTSNIEITEEIWKQNYIDSSHIPDNNLRTIILKNVNKIMNQPEDTSMSLGALPLLTELNLRNGGIKNLKGLEYCYNLNYIDLSYNDITSGWSYLNQNKNRLSTLNISGMHSFDFSSIDNLITLKTLVVNDVSSLLSYDTYLGKFHNLEFLSIKDNSSISDLNQLVYLNKLYYINLSKSHNIDFNTLAIGSLPLISIIDITQCSKTSISKLITNLDIGKSTTLYLGQPGLNQYSNNIPQEEIDILVSRKVNVDLIYN